MDNFVYIKNNAHGVYVTLDELLPDTAYEIGETWLDYLDGKWVLLSEEQVLFHEEYPNASVREVWDMHINLVETPVIDEVLQAKERKIAEIDMYDNSNSVNSFSINGQDMWLNFDERQRIRTSLEAYEAAESTEMSKWFNGIEYTFSIEQWKLMLNMLEMYAAEALNTTESHKAAVNSFTSILDIEEYNITNGYPAKLEF